MKLPQLLLPTAAIGAALFFSGLTTTEAYDLIGHKLGPGQRDFRVFNNFTGAAANNNTTPDPNFPGQVGAPLAIWKACVEWGSSLHGNGNGDPHQPGNLGSGSSNFDPSFQGLANTVGVVGSNIHSAIPGTVPGTFAFAETAVNGDWRIRYYDGYPWTDGPESGIPGSELDLQAVACHEYGHATGLAHSTFSNATMAPATSFGSISKRSISTDDRNGMIANYGAIDPGKPRITGALHNAGVVTIFGTNFDANSNEVWFTRQNFLGSGPVLTVSGVPSPSGTALIVNVPSNAQSGDVLVRNQLAGSLGVSNAWPLDLTGQSCPGPVTYCAGSGNSSSAGGAILQVLGSQNVAANDTQLVVGSAPGNQFGLFVYSQTQTNVPVGNGVLCVGAPFIRLPPVLIDGLGTVFQPLDFTNLPPMGPISQGETWHFQFWYRDPAGGGAGNNLSSAVQVGFCN